jgi:hypothetical protein
MSSVRAATESSIEKAVTFAVISECTVHGRKATQTTTHCGNEFLSIG